MIVIPAVDLREGACVQLVGGEYDAERVRLEDPVAVAREWSRLGFRRLHVVDLDAATVPVFASGGVSSLGELRALADRGVAGAILGMALYTGAIDPRAAVEEFTESAW